MADGGAQQKQQPYMADELPDLYAMWEGMDKNQDQMVSSKEWGQAVTSNQEVLAKYYHGQTIAELGRCFNLIDTNHNGLLSWGEVCKSVQMGELKEMYDSIDKDADGKISSKEWGQSVAQNAYIMGKFFGGQTMKEVGSNFNGLDRNNDGFIDWDEAFVGALCYHRRMEQIWADQYPDLKTLFDAMDKDENGMISSKEWGKNIMQNQELVQKYFGGETPQEVARNFNKIDDNHDGKLSWDEVIKAVQVGPLRELFNSLDKNQDGKLDSKEWGQAVSQHAVVMGKFFGGRTKKEVGENFNCLDKNGDDAVDWSEAFAAAVCWQRGRM